MLVEQLKRRVDNKLVIEQAAVIAALKESSLNDQIIGKEIAKYLEFSDSGKMIKRIIMNWYYD